MNDAGGAPRQGDVDMSLTEFMGRQSKAILVCTGIVLLGAVVFLDKASPPRFETSVFYLVPVSFFAAFLGRRTGLVVSVMCAAIGLAIHRVDLPPSSTIAYWNALAWLAVYVFFVLIIAEIRSLYEREWRWSHLDPLTGVPNRRAFFSHLEIESDRARRHGRPLSLAYIDLDHFKEVNDKYGHSTGDKLLDIVANVIKGDIRKTDVVARLGGDEFAILLPETDRYAAAVTLNKIRLSLDDAMRQTKWPVTFSIGLATFQPPPQSVQAMIDAVDHAMYEAKASGRGRLIVHKPAA